MADEIAQPQPKILGQLIITAFEAPTGMEAVNIQMPVQASEVMMRGLLDKARTMLDDHYRMANAPRIAPGNGSILGLVKRHPRG